MINSKTVFVCIPPIDAFDSTLTIYPQFEEFPEYDDAIRDMSYFFGDTLPYDYEGCPKVKEYADYMMVFINNRNRKDSFNEDTGEYVTGPDPYPNYWKDNIEESQAKSLKSNFKLPRTVSNDKVYFQYFTYYYEKLDTGTIMKYFFKQNLDNKYNFQPDGYFTIYNITMIFCFILVFLSIFDESNESLFCMYVTTRLYVLYCLKKDTPIKQHVFNAIIWFVSVAFSIVRIGYTTTKILIVIILMNWSANIDDLMMNSLALIFVLELDSVTYSWLFDTNKGHEIVCEKFLVTYSRIKIYFNVRYYIPAFFYIYFMYISGIYSYKYPNQSVFELFTKTLDDLLNDKHYDSSVLWYAILYVFSFGCLFEECSFRLYNVVKTKHSSKFMLFLMFVVVFILVYAVTLFFVYTDYDFYVHDFLMCLKNNNINCGNNFLITDLVWSKNLSLLYFTPIYFLISIPMNIIFEFIYNSSTNNNNDLNKDNYPMNEYQIAEDKTISNQIELTNPNDQKKEKEYAKNESNKDQKYIWKVGKSIALFDISLMENYDSYIKTRKNKNFDDLNDTCKVLCVYVENGGEVLVDLQSFAKFNKISTDLAKQVADRTVSLNQSMKEFVDIMEFDDSE